MCSLNERVHSFSSLKKVQPFIGKELGIPHGLSLKSNFPKW